MTAQAHLANLSAEQRRQLESLLLEFEKEWNEQRLGAQLKKVPPSSPLRRPALIELIKIDFERRWQAGRKVLIDGYLKPLPELGTLESLPVDLILAEYQVRRQFGAPTDLAQYGKRFPKQIDELRQRLEQCDSDDKRVAPQGGQALRPTVDLQPETQDTPRVKAGGSSELPEKFGRYLIRRKLGQGGMGAVYLAFDESLDREVALKVPQFKAGDDSAVLERFTREARAAATIQHPNICRSTMSARWTAHLRHHGLYRGQAAFRADRPEQGCRAGCGIAGSQAGDCPARGTPQGSDSPRSEARQYHGQRAEGASDHDFGLARRLNKDDVRLTGRRAILHARLHVARTGQE